MTIENPTPQDSEFRADIVLPFTAINLSSLPIVGGKAANLGEMIHAGLPVPSGFCVTTTAYTLVAEGSQIESILDDLATTDATDTVRIAKLATTARNRLLAAPIPTNINQAITQAYHLLGNGGYVPVAVRSSATAEDLPYASFAGQQETYLNIIGVHALIDAVRRCWASLWTDRAVSYRASLGLDQRRVQLALVVQRMVEAEVAGVLFTANPMTSKRREAVIDANPGLGEAVVSGVTNPDHFEVNTATGVIIERRLSDKRIVIRGTTDGGTVQTESVASPDEACLSDAQIRELARLGAQVEVHYGAPQDIEWASDAAGKLWLTQSRPITTLYPLPVNAPDNDEALRVYWSLNVFQGVLQPLTPMGIAVLRLIGSTAAILFDLAPHDPLNGPSILFDPGSRLFMDVTAALRTKIGRAFLIGATGFAEARSSVLLQQLTADSRLSLKPTPRWRVLRALVSLAAKTRAPLFITQAMFKPRAAVERMQRVRARLEALRVTSPENNAANPAVRLKALEQLMSDWVEPLFRTFPPILASGIGSWGLASRLLKGIAAPDELQIALRALPHNPTTEMDLDLWALSRREAADATAARHVSETGLEQLAQEYRAGTLPPILQQGLADFLYHYGHRGVAEIDVGLPRWREDPTHILGVLANYLQLNDPTLAPDAQFRRGAQEAEAMVADLTQRATRKGRLRGRLVGFFLKRARAMVGLREMPKFCLILIVAYMREVLQSVGQEMAKAGCLGSDEDIFFLTLQEAHATQAGEDMRDIVHERRMAYEYELQRRHVPRVLLSDGTEPSPAVTDGAESQGMLRGTPASPGSITGRARVILEPTGAHLEPGEILIAPSTDPGWTPLFLTAGGLVMEMGGAISHGAVVAREYGIPAVVGVSGATERIITGQHITVDGSNGIVSLEK
jgi:rifampicin phosphotransferase